MTWLLQAGVLLKPVLPQQIVPDPHGSFVVRRNIRAKRRRAKSNGGPVHRDRRTGGAAHRIQLAIRERTVSFERSRARSVVGLASSSPSQVTWRVLARGRGRRR